MRIAVGGLSVQHADHWHCRLLRPRRQRPRHRTADKCDELAPLHSITSSARVSSVAGTVRPSALAVLRLMISSNFVGSCTGRSAGFAPLRMRSIYVAERRNRSAVLLPKDNKPPLSAKYRSL